MNLESLPYIVFILLPGFISWFIFCWGTVTHKLSQLQHLFISLILSIINVVLSYYLIYCLKWISIHWLNTVWDLDAYPELLAILNNSELLPPELGFTVYVFSVLLGFILIKLYKSEKINNIFAKWGFNLHGYESTWYRLFHDPKWVTVYLKDGRIIAGWPTWNSHTSPGDEGGAELYLTKLHYLRKTRGHKIWHEPSGDVAGLYISGDSISHIEFRNSPKEKDTPA